MITTLPIEEKNNFHLVVIVEGEVVGTLMLSRMNQTTMRIEQVAISKKVQGQGLGVTLIEYAEEFSSELGFQYIFLTGRESAWSFYEKLGYEGNGVVEMNGTIRIKEFNKIIRVKEMETNG
ncbi:GNAT family N-acetyltransferase [Vagococcus carniphilus]|uniref:GNAT family N-acetyltransferase n=1 Tax=Vagococcus carniphilus TaxID=218144 RepID=UPI00288F537E|nr:GNAT family N-acetyltransferase [Vagococcus carniphilus]MDT2829421.1 GNAT family N-acetyltransferase [Vagococcus carniphilus]MDT2838880.1 GNAT family N-acetyltransferase [Vagococcus carniphilus]MDT2852938.1 GNAT family N-acetyltransferase [Vagococcus carniphilus]